jgi:hypothetical protein
VVSPTFKLFSAWMKFLIFPVMAWWSVELQHCDTCKSYFITKQSPSVQFVFLVVVTCTHCGLVWWPNTCLTCRHSIPFHSVSLSPEITAFQIVSLNSVGWKKNYELTPMWEKNSTLGDCVVIQKHLVCVSSKKLQATQTVHQFVATLYFTSACSTSIFTSFVLFVLCYCSPNWS